MFLLHKAVKQEKGHGYLRKTKLGLLSGIILTTALGSLFLNGIVSADEQPNSSTPPNAAQTPPSETVVQSEYETSTTHTVKETELKAKVEEVKDLGVKVTETSTENVGVANSSSEVTHLRATAEEKVDAQIRDLESAKAEQAQADADRAKIEEIKNNHLTANYVNVKDKIASQMNSRLASDDVNKEMTLSNLTSSEGEVRYLNTDSVDVRTREGVADALGRDVTTTDTHVTVKTGAANLPGLEQLRAKDSSAGYSGYIVEAKNGETFTYTVNLDPTSVLTSKYGVASIDTSLRLNYTLPEETKVYAIIRGQAILQEIFVKNLSRRVAGQSDLVKYTKTFTYKDAKGQEIQLDKLLSTILNEQAFGGESVIKPSDVPEKKIKEFELRSPISPTGQVLYELRRENSLIGENTISSSNYLNARMPRGRISAYLSQNTFTNKISKVEIIDLDKALNGVSRTFHTVTYTEVQNKGKVTQKFVNEQGTEVRPSVTSEVKAVGEQITLTHPTDIDFENKRYTFKEQDKQDITEIVKGETVITYVYKQKYENNLPPVETETKIPITTTYVEDKTIDYGKEIVESNGSEGKIVTTTPKIVNELDGTVTDGKPTEKETPMVPKVVKVGTKPKVVETTTPYTTRYIEDNTKDKDYREVTRPGKAGKTTTTTTYTLNPNTGAVTSNEPTTITEEAVEEVITVGTKPTVVETTTPYTTRYVEDSTKDKDYREVTRPGKSGKTTTTTTYTLDPNTGAVTPNKPTTITEEAVEEVITVGTKPKVEAPKVETPKVETPKVETPKVETPKVETPKVETPKVETPKVEAPKVEAPKVEAPKVEAPKIEVPKSKTPTEQSTKETSQIPTSVASKREELPNTGTEDHDNLVVLGLLGVLSGFGFLAHKKKEVEK